MNVYTNNQFEGHYPVGASAVVVANSPLHACLLLRAMLDEQGLDVDSVQEEDMVEVNTEVPGVRILNDGDY